MLSIQSRLQLTHDAGTVQLTTLRPDQHDLRFSNRKVLRQFIRAGKSDGIPISLLPAIRQFQATGQQFRIYVGESRIWTLRNRWIDRLVLRMLL